MSTPHEQTQVLQGALPLLQRLLKSKADAETAQFHVESRTTVIQGRLKTLEDWWPLEEQGPPSLFPVAPVGLNMIVKTELLLINHRVH